MLAAQLFAVAPLFAIGDLIGLIIWIIIIVVSVVSKISKAAGGGAKQQEPQANRPPPQIRPQARAGGNKGIESEIEEFLRQARGEKARQTPVQASPPPRQANPAARAKPQPPRQFRPRVIEAQPVDRDIVPGEGFGRSVSEHVRDHIGKDSISTRDAHLGESIESADERIEQHLEDVFDHDVGHLDHAVKVDTSIAEGTDALDNENVDKQSSEAKRIRQMLSSPDSVREVFIAAEILKRPEV